MSTYQQRYKELQDQIAETELALNLLYAELKDLQESRQHLAISHLERYMRIATPKLADIREFIRQLRADCRLVH